jgi:glucose/arabinose dehydrogenase
MHVPQRSKMVAAATGTALLTAAFVLQLRAPLSGQQTGPGQQAASKPLVFSDYKQQTPGTMHKITAADLPEPNEAESGFFGPKVVPRPAGATLKTMPGFSVTEYATGLEKPRWIRKAPNGDLFVAESDAGRIKVLHGVGADGKAQSIEIFATGLVKPYGIAFYPAGANPKYVYVGETNALVRFPYQNGDVKARGPKEKLADLPGSGATRGGGHWTRAIGFSLDGKKIFVGVGSLSNVDDADTHPLEKERADVLEFTPDGQGRKIYASGVRNCAGLAVQPKTGDVWCSTNERDGLGNNLVPDYITHLQEGGFYGWPWYYTGGHQDPRHAGKHPELKDKAIVPDVLLQPHNASLQLTFYDGKQFPSEYQGDIFASEHGSWNRSSRTGYEVIRVPMKDGRATGEYQDFLTGFVVSDTEVWGRPVGIAVAQDGSLIVTDDASNTVWRISASKAGS